jgi:hypothetical protein
MSKLIPWAIGLLLLLGLGLWARSWLRDHDRDLQEKADRRRAKELVQTATWWMAQVAQVRAQAARDTMEARGHEAKADKAADKLAQLPPAPARGEVTDSALADYWEKRAWLEHDEKVNLRLALDSQKRATTKFALAADSLTGRVSVLDSALAKAVKREEDRGKFSMGLGIRLPKPPKWLAGTLGCAAGGTLAYVITKAPAPGQEDRRPGNTLKGCGLGGAAATIVTPTD